MRAKVEIKVSVSKQFHKMLQQIANGMVRMVEELLLRSIVSTVEAIEDAGQDQVLAVGGPPEIDCDPDMLALAVGAKKKPFLSPEEIQALSDRFADALGALQQPAEPLQLGGRCQIIDLAAWKRG
jgi:3-oxoacyl-(acyl-carrier-protein) synthase